MRNTGYRLQVTGSRIKRNNKLVTRYLLLVTIFLLFTMVYSHASNYQITNIEVIDNAVKIKVDGTIKYKISSPADPFRVTVDIEGVSLGRFSDKIYSRQAGITEISLTQIETPVITSRLDILLQSPSIIKPEIQGDTLILYVESKNDAAKQELIDKRVDRDISQHEGRDKANDKSGGNVAKEIAAVVFDKTDVGIELVIKGDGVMPEPAVLELDGKIMIDIPNIVMKAALPTSIPSPVKDLKYKAEKGNVRFILGIEGKVDTEVVAMEDEIVVDIATKQKSEDRSQKIEVETANSKLQTPNSNLVSLDFQDADIVPILRLLGDVSGYNIVIHPDVKGKISMKLMNVPWEQALDIVLKTFNLEKVIEGNVIRVATLKAFQEEKKAVAETKEVFGKAEDIETRVFIVNYANVDKIRESIDKAKVLSPRGSISTDVRTRSIIVKDIPSSLNGIQRLIKDLDKSTPQVLIEARMVEMNTNYAKSLGIEWGGQYLPRMGDDNTVLRGGLGTTITGGQSTGVGLVNLPASTSTLSPTTAITVGYLNAAQTFGLDLRISAVEATGKGKVISSPKIMTIDNEQAVIKHGAQIPVTTRMPDGTFSTTYKDANIKLTVTPQVTPEGTIFLKIEVNKDEPDFTRTDNLGNPTINSRSASTQVLVKDGDTVVIGGMLKSNESDSESGVPGISKIPILGWLFKKETKETTAEELLIFITPRIVKQQ